MRKFIVGLIAVLVILSVCYAESQRLTYDVVSNPNQLQRYVQDPIFPGTVQIRGRTRIGKLWISVEAANQTLTSSDSGKVVVTTAGTGTQTFTLPPAVAGLHFILVDIGISATDTLIINTASDSDLLLNVATSATTTRSNVGLKRGSMELIALDATNWWIENETGSWTFETQEDDVL